ncbi:MAG: hypothetical protein AUK44_02985 [Porphyromonadaceae bacterium CG2_30_38_12]|nr:MAG: hypothetical protein AUK44_02985 [Porphyromonadaceae bacterium CG2_30_38_12]
MKTKILILTLFTYILASCTQSGTSLPAVSGTQFELLVVMNDTLWKDSAGRELHDLLTQPMLGLPQYEPVLAIHQCSRTEFTDVLKPSRNVLLVDVAAKYSAPKITYSKDHYAYPQAFVKITAPSDTSLQTTIKKYGSYIVAYFVKSERERQIAFNKSYINDNAKTEIEKQFGIQIDIPQGISKATQKKDFYWITNDQAGTRQDILIYAYPYTNKSQFTKAALIVKRDSILKANIPGELKDSYMGTELKYADPIFQEIWVNKNYCAELRGLWRMMHGAAMGGPFYSHSRLDEINQRVITMEAFVFAPGKNKRNAMRQLEAVIFTAKLPQEINAIKEVSVVAPKKKK